MIVSVLYLLVRCLLGCLTVLTRHQVSEVDDSTRAPSVLRHHGQALEPGADRDDRRWSLVGWKAVML